MLILKVHRRRFGQVYKVDVCLKPEHFHDILFRHWLREVGHHVPVKQEFKQHRGEKSSCARQTKAARHNALQPRYFKYL